MGKPGTPAGSTGSKIVLWQLSKEWIPGPEATKHIRIMGPQLGPQLILQSSPVGSSALRAAKEHLTKACWEGAAWSNSYPHTATENVSKTPEHLIHFLSKRKYQCPPPSIQNRDYQLPWRFFKIQFIGAPVLDIVNLCVNWDWFISHSEVFPKHSLCSGSHVSHRDMFRKE
jgi:hypothetical protein